MGLKEGYQKGGRYKIEKAKNRYSSRGLMLFSGLCAEEKKGARAQLCKPLSLVRLELTDTEAEYCCTCSDIVNQQANKVIILSQTWVLRRDEGTKFGSGTVWFLNPGIFYWVCIGQLRGEAR